MAANDVPAGLHALINEDGNAVLLVSQECARLRPLGNQDGLPAGAVVDPFNPAHVAFVDSLLVPTHHQEHIPAFNDAKRLQRAVDTRRLALRMAISYISPLKKNQTKN
jgi:hypothetical protein